MIKSLSVYAMLGIASASLGANATATPLAQKDESFSPEQVKSIEAIVHDYLVNNPEVLVEASNALRVKMEQEQESKAMVAIKENKATLFDDTNTPFAGNPQGTEVIVEFFDYQCPHCKEMKTAMENLLNKNPNLKIIFRDWPIFGGASLTAAKAALAAHKQGQYLAMHKALLDAENPLTDEKINDIAQSLGLDMALLKKDMEDPATMNQIKATFALSKELGLSGTPVFIIANQSKDNIKFLPGSTTQKKLQQLLNELK